MGGTGFCDCEGRAFEEFPFLCLSVPGSMLITPHLAVRALSVASPWLLAGVVGAQGFGGDQVISTALDGAFSVHATDLDGDGDQDVHRLV